MTGDRTAHSAKYHCSRARTGAVRDPETDSHITSPEIRGWSRRGARTDMASRARCLRSPEDPSSRRARTGRVAPSGVENSGLSPAPQGDRQTRKSGRTAAAGSQAALLHPCQRRHIARGSSDDRTRRSGDRVRCGLARPTQERKRHGGRLRGRAGTFRAGGAATGVGQPVGIPLGPRREGATRLIDAGRGEGGIGGGRWHRRGR